MYMRIRGVSETVKVWKEISCYPHVFLKNLITSLVKGRGQSFSTQNLGGVPVSNDVVNNSANQRADYKTGPEKKFWQQEN